MQSDCSGSAIADRLWRHDHNILFSQLLAPSFEIGHVQKHGQLEPAVHTFTCVSEKRPGSREIRPEDTFLLSSIENVMVAVAQQACSSASYVTPCVSCCLRVSACFILG